MEVIFLSPYHLLLFWWTPASELIVDNLSPSCGGEENENRDETIPCFLGQPLYPEAAVVTNIIQSFVITFSMKLWSKQKLLLLIRPQKNYFIFLKTGIEIDFFFRKFFTQRGNQINRNMWAEWKRESWWNNLMFLGFFPGVATWQTTIYNLQFAIHPSTDDGNKQQQAQHYGIIINDQIVKIIMNYIFMLL